MLPENSEPEIVPAAPRQGWKLWVQILLVVGIAFVALALGLVDAYASRCKPGQGNDWCGLGSVAGVLFGLGAAVCTLVVGAIVIVLKRRGRGGGGKVGALRILSVVLGVLLVLCCTWTLVIGGSGHHSDGGSWLGLALGLGLIGVAFVRRRRA
jgi:drug/metabolite transporter (DMT)-like permease